jgi:hypothetical protein
MNLKIPQLSFAKGEVEEGLQIRYDLAFIGSALRRAYNFFVKPQGGVENRPGTRAMHSTKYADKKAILIPFEFNSGQFFMLEFGDGYARFFTTDGLVMKDGEIYEIASPYGEADLEYIYYEQIADVVYLACGLSGKKAHTLTRRGNTDWEFAEYKFKDGPFLARNTNEPGILITNNSGIINLSCSQPIFKTPPELYRIHLQLEPQSEYGSYTGASSSTAFLCNNQWRLFTSATWTGSVYVEYSKDKINWTGLRKYSSYGDYNVDVYGEIPEDLAWVRIRAQISGGNPVSYKFSVVNEPLYLVFRTVSVSEDKKTAEASIESDVAGLGALFPDTPAFSNIEELIPYLSSSNPNAFAVPENNSAWYAFANWGTASFLWAATQLGYQFQSTVFVTNVSFGAMLGNTMTEKTGTCDFIIKLDAGGESASYSGSLEIDNSWWRRVSVDIPLTRAETISILFPGGQPGSIQRISARGYKLSGAVQKLEQDWARAAFSEDEGWPEAVTVFQGRICWTKDDTNYATETESYNSFKRSAPLVDSDGVTTSLLSTNRINSIAGLNRLVAFTDDGYYATNGEAYTPANFAMPKRSGNGGGRARPVIIGNRIVYATPKGSGIRDIAYDFGEYTGESGDDLRLLATHLFVNRRIKSMAYLQEPSSLFFVLFNDGKMATLTYLREQEVLAWTQFETDGIIESIRAGSAEDYNELWLMVKRGDKKLVEKLSPRRASRDIKEQFFVDCGVTRRFAEPTGVIDELEHLEGRAVAVLADGFVVRGCVVNNGAITLPNNMKASVVHVGLPYMSEIETLPMGFNIQNGSLLAVKKRIAKAWVKFVDTAGGWIGTRVRQQAGRPFDEKANMMYPFDERPLANTPQPLASGLKRQNLSSASHEELTLVIQQRDPLPMEISGIIPETEAGG